MLATQSILSDQLLYNLGSHRQTDTQHLHLCPLFQPPFPVNKQYLHIMYTPNLWEHSGFNEVSPPPPPTVSFKLLQYILLLYLKEIHYLGKLCILVQGFLLCRNEHKHKINERVWALNWSWIVKKFVFSLYLFSFAVNLCTSTMLLVLWVCLVVEI